MKRIINLAGGRIQLRMDRFNGAIAEELEQVDINRGRTDVGYTVIVDGEEVGRISRERDIEGRVSWISLDGVITRCDTRRRALGFVLPYEYRKLI